MINIKKIGFWLLILISQCLSQSIGNFETTYDDFDDVRISQMLVQKDRDFWTGNEKKLTLMEITRQGNSKLLCEVLYKAKDWIFITEDDLGVKLDSETLRLQYLSESRDVLRNYIVEKAIYDVDYKILKKIAKSKSMTYRYYSQKGYVDIELDNEELQYIRNFIIGIEKYNPVYTNNSSESEDIIESPENAKNEFPRTITLKSPADTICAKLYLKLSFEGHFEAISNEVFQSFIECKEKLK